MSRFVRRFVALILSVALSRGLNSIGGAEPDFRPPKLKVRSGFTVELAAAPPLVKHPLFAGFDERGRLFVAESAGESLSAEELQKRKPDFIRLLEEAATKATPSQQSLAASIRD